MKRGLRVTEQELWDLLVARLGVIPEPEFAKARRMSSQLRIPLENALVERGRVPFAFILEQLADAWKVPWIDLKAGDVDPDALALVPEDYARRHDVIPFQADARDVKIAMTDPRDRQLVADLERHTGRRVTPYLAPEGVIRRAHLLYRGDLRKMLERVADEDAHPPARSGGPLQDDRTAVDLVSRLLEYAALSRASDIHIEPHQHEGIVRYRIDGVLHEVLSLDPEKLPSLVGRIKILAGMRIDERRAPQDGRIEADLGGFTVDFRVSSMPTLWGEKVVMRVLSKETVPLDLEDLGLSAADHDALVRNILRPFGMVLITGPTGSGKTSTLYASLMRLGVERQNAVNISTVEDPIEYTVPRVNQIAVNPAAGLVFASSLRALLRQDPDVIMVGEIRDRETAEIAVRAALVGRLLLSTLHTNDSTGALPRLLDMGVEPFLIASVLSLVVAQRLVRRICVSCRESVIADPSVVAALRGRPDFAHTVRVLRAQGVLGSADDPLTGIRFYRGRGCRQCNHTGFRGRIGVFELFETDDQIRRMIMERQDVGTVRTEAIARGMRTMFEDGLAKALLGDTTLEEVYRVAP